VHGAGSEEPNALVQLSRDARTEPNVRATTAELFDGLVASSQNRWPSLALDVGALNGALSRLLPAGFYYKTFMWPPTPKAWLRYERLVRAAAGAVEDPCPRDRPRERRARAQHRLREQRPARDVARRRCGNLREALWRAPRHARRRVHEQRQRVCVGSGLGHCRCRDRRDCR